MSRLRRSITLAPGFRVNHSGSGAGWALPPPGVPVLAGEQGQRSGNGVTGFSSSSPFRASVRNRIRAGRKELTAVSMTCAVDEDGSLLFHGVDGELLSGPITNAAKKQHRAAILALLQKKCDHINNTVYALGNMHLRTPDCRDRPVFQPAPFEVPPPIRPIPRKPSVIDVVLPTWLVRLEAASKRTLASYQTELALWKQARLEFDQQQAAKRQLVEEGIYQSVEDMGTWLTEKLHAIHWLRQTHVGFEISDTGRSVQLDVCLPALQDMPKRRAYMPSRGLKLMVRNMTPARVRRLYVRHIHSVLFRLIGEAFAALPTVQTVLISGYSHLDGCPEVIDDDKCLISVSAHRSLWQTIGIAHLKTFNVVNVLERLQLRRNMTGAGELQPVLAFSMQDLPKN